MTGIVSTELAFYSSTDPLEHLLADLWEQVLLVKISPDDNFFELGGNSIKAVMVMNRLQDKMNAIFHPASIFNAPTVSDLAKYCRKNYPDIFKTTAADQALDEKLSNDQIKMARQHLLHRNSAKNVQVDTIGGKNKPAIFILSPPRSGSTLLRVMLGGHPNLFSPPELYLLSFNTLKQRKEKFSGSLDFFREGLIRALMELKNGSKKEAEVLMNRLEEQNMSTKAFIGLMQTWADDKRIVDKTPSYVFNPEVLCRAEMEFADALFIHLVRHPMASIASFEEIRADLVTGDSNNELPLSAKQKGELWWLISQQNILSFLEGIPGHRQHQLKFEDMVAEPERITQQLCGFLGIQFHLDMLNPYQEKKNRMTDGVSDVSKVMGDQKFHTYQIIEATVADRWRDKYKQDFLCEQSWQMAETLGYMKESFTETEREEWEI